MKKRSNGDVSHVSFLSLTSIHMYICIYNLCIYIYGYNMAIILYLFLEVAISNITIDVALQSSQPQSSQCHPVGPPGTDHTVAIGCVSHGILPPNLWWRLWGKHGKYGKYGKIRINHRSLGIHPYNMIYVQTKQDIRNLWLWQEMTGDGMDTMRMMGYGMDTIRGGTKMHSQ